MKHFFYLARYTSLCTFGWFYLTNLSTYIFPHDQQLTFLNALQYLVAPAFFELSTSLNHLFAACQCYTKGYDNPFFRLTHFGKQLE